MIEFVLSDYSTVLKFVTILSCSGLNLKLIEFALSDYSTVLIFVTTSYCRSNMVSTMSGICLWFTVNHCPAACTNCQYEWLLAKTLEQLNKCLFRVFLRINNEKSDVNMENTEKEKL